MAADANRHESSALFYLAIYFALLVGTGATLGLSRLDMGWFNLPVALVIAFAKGSLVVLFFMHLLHERGASRMVIVVALIFLASLALLVVADAGTRFPLAVVREGTTNLAR